MMFSANQTETLRRCHERAAFAVMSDDELTGKIVTIECDGSYTHNPAKRRRWFALRAEQSRRSQERAL